MFLHFRLFRVLLLTFISFAYSTSLIGQFAKEHYIAPFNSFSNSAIGQVEAIFETQDSHGFFVYSYAGISKTPFDSTYVKRSTVRNKSLGKNLSSPLISGINRLNIPLNKKGVVFRAETPFSLTIYCASKSHAANVVSKGKKALGKLFYSGHMISSYKQDDYASFDENHFISVMAVHDNTVITFSNPNEGVTFLNQPKTTFTITLDKGQSYVIAEKLSNMNDTIINQYNGTKIESSKDITVVSGSGLMKPANRDDFSTTNNQYFNDSGDEEEEEIQIEDIGFDQLFATPNLGSEYVFCKGLGSENEFPMVIATEDGTTIIINHKEKKMVSLNKGDVHIFQHRFTSHGVLHIKSNHPLAAFQNTSGSTHPYAQGFNTVPPFNGCSTKGEIHFS
ncbi:MAG: IgGFc-binding protein, partial [Cyclobacteriaceae bacterium]